tara:strand:+ start:4598 stop:7000 length:2403 start_codon:yes stop_codon:yes gene_type:complete
MWLAIVLFFLLLGVVLYHRLSLAAASGSMVAGAVVLALFASGMWIFALLTIAVAALLNVDAWRKKWLVEPAYKALRAAMPPMSVTEQEALEAGTTWWEKDVFSGRPDWERFASIQLSTLSDEEQQFLDNEVNELCGLIDEWDVQERQDLSPETWAFLREKGFFGLIIPTEFGGRDFSPNAQSRIMSKIASRSITAAVTAMVPNSLGPGELLVKYGTEEQKQRWLPGLADGSELPCFGLTGPEAGSDAGAIPDVGVVCKGEHEGEEVVGLLMQFSKRWITLAPVATVVGLAFQLRDPDGLLGDPDTVDYGITCALLPADHPGIEIGNRHNPGAPFMNGPIKGKDVFIPLDWIIGGAEMAGKGWRMLIECLGAGRGVSLPALATAGAEMCYVNVGAYSRIRRQFNLEVGKFEGVQEVTAEIAAGAYMLEALRQFVTRGLEDGAPSVLTAMAKYHATETMRDVVNHGMDVVGGRGIQLGPRNFMASMYHALPVAITVEGANILTRSLMIFGQGAMRCHPYLYEEMQTLQHSDTAQAQRDFDPLLMKHLSHASSNLVGLVYLGLTKARFSSVPSGADKFSAPWFRRINHFSAALAIGADVALGVLGGDLKRRELLSARLGDVHSQLVIACSILKFHSSGRRNAATDAHASFALQQALYAAQQAYIDYCDNFPMRWLGHLLRAFCLPYGRVLAKPDDRQIRELGELIMEPNSVRQALAEYVFIPSDPEDAVGRLQRVYDTLLQIQQPWEAFTRAWQKGELQGDTLDEALSAAVASGLISSEQQAQIKDYEEIRYDCLLTDNFENL